jgi:hypothetical protein
MLFRMKKRAKKNATINRETTLEELLSPFLHSRFVFLIVQQQKGFSIEKFETVKIYLKVKVFFHV